MEQLFQLSNLNTRPYLEKKVLPDLRECTKTCLGMSSNQVNSTGTGSQSKNKIELPRKEREMLKLTGKRIDQGSAYNSDCDDNFDVSVESSSDYDSEDECHPERQNRNYRGG
jgi:hypothetical protein